MWVSKYFLWFILYSCWGWIFETLYALVKTGKWENRGFLYGPLCPIYGSGAVAITAVCTFIEEKSGAPLWWWQVFAIAFFGSMVLEYGTSWVMEKLFHAIWWDYSNVPLNLHGRICLPASLTFGCAGLLIVYVMAPEVNALTEQLSPLSIEAFSLLVMAIAAGDTTLTVSALTDFELRVAELDEHVNRYMENFVEGLQEKKAEKAHLIREEQNRIYRQSIERMLRPMNYPSRSALKRVKRFRHHHEKMSELFNRIHQNLRNKRHSQD